MSSTKPILVTGAAGLVGRELLRQLAEAARPVIGIDAVIHCGAYSGPMVARDAPYSMVQVNIVGTANMLELARVHEARRFVYCSSTSAYGVVRGGVVPVAEDRPLRPASLYGASKVASEAITTAYANQYRLSAASIRLSWVYGPGRTTDCMIRTAIEDALAGLSTRMAFGADFPRQFVHVEDAVRGLLKALDAPVLPQRVYNVTGDSRLTLGEIAAAICNEIPGADIQLEPGDDPVDEFQEKFSIDAARRDLGYVPAISLRDGIRSYAAWLQRNDGRRV